MPRGGYHPNAERWGRKSAWLNDSDTKTIRVPKALAEQVLDLAHKLDAEEFINYETKAKEEATQLKIELEQMRQERDRLAQELATCRASQPQQPDLESSRDRYLASLKLGKQAPDYKRTKKAIDGFINQLQSD
jgi:hypothetical protein